MAYSPGQIVRIKCENILTYQSIEIFPCPKLNLIIGANGTGKSTIISAIILGLGGNAAVVGRAQDLKQYVKVGQKQASIEIELFDPTGDGNVIIERHFNVRGESKFLYNRKSISHERLERRVRNFHIQIDNLCQILPQEKLEQFAKMNTSERLSGTLRTVGDRDLCKDLEILKNSKETEKEIQKQLAHNRDKVVELQSKRDAMEIEVKTCKEKNFLVECYKLSRKRYEWQFYFHLKQALNMIEDSIKSKQTASRKLTEVLKSTLADVHESSTKVNNAKAAMRKTNEKVSAVIRNVKEKQNEINVMTDKVSDVKSEFKRNELKLKSQENDIKMLQEKIQKTENDITNVSQVDRELNVLKAKLENLERSNYQTETSKEAVSDNLSGKINEMRSSESKLKRLNDVYEQKMRILEREYADSFKGVKWLEENRRLFRGEVYGPMFLYLNVTDSQYAKYVESSIGNRDLVAFICELAEDTTTLMVELREKRKFKVSIVTARSDEDVRPPYPIESLKSLGFQCYVNSLISGPSIIVQYLTLEYRLHCIPIGNAHTFNVTDKVPSDIRVFFTDKYRLAVRIVEYTGEKIESSSEIPPARYLASSTNTSAMEQFKEQYARCEREVNRLKEELQKLAEKVTAGDDECRTLRHEMKNLENKKFAQNRLQETLRINKRELHRLQNLKVDLDTERRKCNMEVKLLLAKVTNKYVELCQTFHELFKSFIEYQQDKINVDQFERIHSKNLSSTLEFVKTLSKETSFLREIEKKKKKLAIVTQSCYKHVMKFTKGVDPRSREFKNRDMFFKLPSNFVVLTRLIHTFRAKVDCLGGNTGGMNIMKDYRALIKELAYYEKKVAKKEELLQTHFSDIDQKKQNFVTQVKKLIETIDNNFRKFFEMMGCVGTVCLYEGEEGNDDFNKYGIHIKVKFRKEGELHILNSQIQSGGERAVSIAIYLLSLQELTSVPFRCIDEINQGMDADNERRIFNLITQATEERGNTQYFLLTPKLLPNLNFTANSKIFFPYNGVGSIPHKKYSQFVEKRRASQGNATAHCSSSFS